MPKVNYWGMHASRSRSALCQMKQATLRGPENASDPQRLSFLPPQWSSQAEYSHCPASRAAKCPHLACQLFNVMKQTKTNKTN